jgi:hypothetical protein
VKRQHADPDCRRILYQQLHSVESARVEPIIADPNRFAPSRKVSAREGTAFRSCHDRFGLFFYAFMSTHPRLVLCAVSIPSPQLRVPSSSGRARCATPPAICRRCRACFPLDLAQNLGQHTLAIDVRRAAQIEGIEIKDVKHIVDQTLRAALSLQLFFERVKVGKAFRHSNDHLAIEDESVLGQRAEGSHEIAETIGPVISATRKEADALMDVALEAIAIEFDFVQPFIAIRRPRGKRRQLRLDEFRKFCAFCAAQRTRER